MNLTLTVTVRAALPEPRSMVATDSAMRRAWRSSTARSVRSWLNVSSCPIDLVGRSGVTGSGSSPRARAARCSPLAWPNRRARVSDGSAARSPTVRTPRSCRRVGRGRSHPPQRLDRVRVEEVDLGVRSDREPHRAPARVRPGWPAAWPPARPAWRSSWSARPPPRSRATARRAPFGAAPGRSARADPAGARAPATSRNASSSPIGSTWG